MKTLNTTEMRIRLILLTAFLSLAGCVEDPVPQVDNGEYFIGEVFYANFNECVTLVDSVENKIYSLCFDSVSDQRPYWSQCILIYCICPAEVTVHWVEADGDTAAIALSIPGCGPTGACGVEDMNYTPSVDTLGFRFCLLQLDPHPDTDNINAPIDQNDYVAKIQITWL